MHSHFRPTLNNSKKTLLSSTGLKVVDALRTSSLDLQCLLIDNHKELSYHHKEQGIPVVPCRVVIDFCRCEVMYFLQI